MPKQKLTDVQIKWIEALESGEYKQARNFLKLKSGEYCCLGVAVELYDSENWSIDKELHKYYVYNNGNTCTNHATDLPEEIYQWLGLYDSVGSNVTRNEKLAREYGVEYDYDSDHREYDDKGRCSYPSLNSLIELNDEGLSFEDIAEELRNKPENYFMDTTKDEG